MKNTTSDNKDLIGYDQDVEKHPVLSEDLQKQLALQAQKGDMKAREKLVLSNLRFVIEIAKKYQHSGIPLAELASEGSFGLFEAIKRFDPKKQTSFISYAAWWIKDPIVRLVNQARLIRVPANKTRKLSQIRQMEDSLFQDDETRNNAEEVIAKNLDISVSDIAYHKRLLQEINSLDREIEIDGDGNMARGDIVEDTNAESPDESVLHKEEHKAIQYCLSKIPKREAEIIKKRFGFGGGRVMSLSELSKEYTLTKERIRQLEKKAISRMQEFARDIGMRDVA